MGIRGELFSTRVSTEGRTYFFNVKENRMGDVFLTIVESKPTETENFDRRSIVVFKDDVKTFLKAFQGALSYMEGSDSGSATGEALHFAGASSRATASAGRKPHSLAGFAGADDKSRRPSEAGSEKKRRIVVKKKPKSGSSPEAPKGSTH